MFKFSLLVTTLALFSMPASAGFSDFITNAVDSAVDNAVQEVVEEIEPASPTLATAKGDLWTEIRVQWGQSATPNNVSVIKHDVTCDGHIDHIASRLNQDNPDGPFFDVMIVTKDGGTIMSEQISLAFDGSQDGLCEPMGEPDIEVSIEHWDESQLDSELGGWEGICTEAIRVDDGMCDAPRYFWLTGERDADQLRVMSYRN